MKSTEISIIALSYNTKKVTNKCLVELKKSVKYFEEQTNKKIEVIVIDNASPDGSAEFIATKYPWVKLIRSDINLGFAKANNLGMKKAEGKYFLLLNSDAFVKRGTLLKAWRYLEKNQNTDILGCKFVYKSGNFQPSGGYLPTPMRTISLMLGIDKIPIIRNLIGPIHPKSKHFFKKENNLEWTMGAFMFMRASVFKKTGGFDERFFMYTEEVEWCKRMKDKGFNLVYTPSFSVTHLGAASSSDKSIPIVREAQGLIKYHQKHYPSSVRLIKMVIKLGFFVRFVLFSILRDSRADSYRKALV